MSKELEAAVPSPEELITDWYLPESDALEGFIYPGPVQIKEFPRLFDMATQMLKMSKERTKGGKVDFTIRIAGRSYRGHKMGSTVTGAMFVLRRLPDYVPSLEKLGVPMTVRQLLVHPSLSKGGLVLVCGETGQGKSTTCAATVKERMERMGNFCMTIEDPPEMPLHGRHGLGRCIQTEVEDGDWAEAMKGAMRCYPTTSGSMLYVGETRDRETAAESLRIATNGHLVLSTLHAESLETAIQRYQSLASHYLGAADTQFIMASSFRLAIHQELKDEVHQNRSRKRLTASFLFSPNGRSPVGQKIRAGTESLNNEIKMQEMAMRNGGAEAVLGMWK